MKTDRKLTLHDINPAAFLEFRGVKITLKAQDTGRVVFEAEATNKAYKVLGEYQENPTVPILDYLSHLRRLRGLMLQLRSANGERSNGNAKRTAINIGSKPPTE